LEDAEDKKQSQELEAMEMSIGALIRTTKEAMAEEKEAVAQAQQDRRASRRGCGRKGGGGGIPDQRGSSQR
jgi:septal ring factor EnvC (AmiA/AmiB activator)